jgi:hypothetical protein
MLLSTHILSLSQKPVDASEPKVTPYRWNNVTFEGNAPFKPLASATRIIVLFFLSLIPIPAIVLSAALAPRPHRLFSEIARGSGPPARPVETAFHIPLFLSISVFLFTAGVFDFLLSTNKVVALCVLGSVPVLPPVCLACTALPSLCPYEARHDHSLPRWSRFVWRGVTQILGLVVVVVVVGQIGNVFTIFCRRIGIRPFCARQRILLLLPR